MRFISLFGLALSIGGIALGHFIEGGTLTALFQPAAFFIVIGGTLGAVFMQSSLPTFIRALKAGLLSFGQPALNFGEHAAELVRYARQATSSTLLALDSRLQAIDEPFLHRALTLVVDQYPTRLLKTTLLMDAQAHLNRQKELARTWEAAAGYAPTIGIVGSVLGLLHVMGALEDPSKLGAGIAVSFVATLYGLVLANLVCLPISARLRAAMTEQAAYYEMCVEAAWMMAKNEQPRLIAERLQSYVLDGKITRTGNYEPIHHSDVISTKEDPYEAASA